MLVYLIMTVLSVGFAYVAQREKSRTSALNVRGYSIHVLPRVCALLSFLPMFLVAALRYEIGVDYSSYIRIFDEILAGRRTYVEFGFYILVKAITLVTVNPQWLFAASAFISISIIVYTLYRYTDHFALGVFLYICMGFFFHTMGSQRYYIAVSLVFLTGCLALNKKWGKAALAIFIAFLFHKSSLFVIPIIFFARFKYSFKTYLFMIVAGISLPLFSPLLRQILFVFYPDYQNSVFDNNRVSYYNVLLTLTVLIWGVLYYKAAMKENSKDVFFFNQAFFAAVFYCCASRFIPEASRIGFYMVIFDLIYIPKLILYDKNPKVNRFYFVAVVLLFIAFCIILLLQDLPRYGKLYLPYQIIKGIM